MCLADFQQCSTTALVLNPFLPFGSSSIEAGSWSCLQMRLTRSVAPATCSQANTSGRSHLRSGSPYSLKMCHCPAIDQHTHLRAVENISLSNCKVTNRSHQIVKNFKPRILKFGENVEPVEPVSTAGVLGWDYSIPARTIPLQLHAQHGSSPWGDLISQEPSEWKRSVTYWFGFPKFCQVRQEWHMAPKQRIRRLGGLIEMCLPTIYQQGHHQPQPGPLKQDTHA